MLDLIQLGSPTFMDLLDHTARDGLIAAANTVRYQDGQLIHSRGADKPGLSVVKQGAAQISVTGVDGKFVMVGKLRAGESFGEFTLYTDLPRTHDISAAGDSEVYQLTQRQFRRLEDRFPQISRALLTASLLRNYQLLEALDDMRRLTLVQRTAKLLLAMSYSSVEPDGSIVCRQDEMAYTLGVSRVSLSKALKQLVELELIRLGYARIQPTSEQQLQEWVAEHCNTTPLHWRADQTGVA